MDKKTYDVSQFKPVDRFFWGWMGSSVVPLAYLEWGPLYGALFGIALYICSIKAIQNIDHANLRKLMSPKED